jgi:hypothetical protein
VGGAVTGNVITKPKIVLVEGHDEVQFFSALSDYLGLSVDVEIREVGGTRGFSAAVRSLLRDSMRNKLSSLVVARDADRSPQGAFHSVRNLLGNAGLPSPREPFAMVEGDASDPVIGRLRVGAMILPSGSSPGMLEDLCLMAAQDDPAMQCVDDYFRCLESALDRENMPRNEPKARVRAFLCSHELWEESHFEFIRNHIEQWLPGMPNAPSVEQVHAFLASRYRPSLNLGLAAQAGYWDFEHSAFAEMREFLSSL